MHNISKCPTFRNQSCSLDTQARSCSFAGRPKLKWLPQSARHPGNPLKMAGLSAAKTSALTPYGTAGITRLSRFGPVFVEDPNEIVVVTVYVYYF